MRKRTAIWLVAVLVSGSVSYGGTGAPDAVLNSQTSKRQLASAEVDWANEALGSIYVLTCDAQGYMLFDWAVSDNGRIVRMDPKDISYHVEGTVWKATYFIRRIICTPDGADEVFGVSHYDFSEEVRAKNAGAGLPAFGLTASGRSPGASGGSRTASTIEKLRSNPLEIKPAQGTFSLRIGNQQQSGRLFVTPADSGSPEQACLIIFVPGIPAEEAGTLSSMPIGKCFFQRATFTAGNNYSARLTPDKWTAAEWGESCFSLENTTRSLSSASPGARQDPSSAAVAVAGSEQSTALLDKREVLSKYRKAIDGYAELEEWVKGLQAPIDALSEKIEKAKADYERGKSELSANAAAAEEEKIQTLYADYQEKMKTEQDKIDKREKELFDLLIAEIDAAAEEIRASRGYAYVKDWTTQTEANLPQNAIDITQQIIEVLNKKYLRLTPSAPVKP